MELAAYAADSKSDNLADLTLDATATGAASTLDAAVEPLEAGDVDRMTEQMFGCPFNASDFKNLDLEWIRSKLLWQRRIPAIAAWCIDCRKPIKSLRKALVVSFEASVLKQINSLAQIAGAINPGRKY